MCYFQLPITLPTIFSISKSHYIPHNRHAVLCRLLVTMGEKSHKTTLVIPENKAHPTLKRMGNNTRRKFVSLLMPRLTYPRNFDLFWALKYSCMEALQYEYIMYSGYNGDQICCECKETLNIVLVEEMDFFVTSCMSIIDV